MFRFAVVVGESVTGGAVMLNEAASVPDKVAVIPVSDSRPTLLSVTVVDTEAPNSAEPTAKVPPDSKFCPL